jgi:hypothetical protein
LRGSLFSLFQKVSGFVQGGLVVHVFAEVVSRDEADLLQFWVEIKETPDLLRRDVAIQINAALKIAAQKFFVFGVADDFGFHFFDFSVFGLVGQEWRGDRTRAGGLD